MSIAPDGGVVTFPPLKREGRIVLSEAKDAGRDHFAHHASLNSYLPLVGRSKRLPRAPHPGNHNRWRAKARQGAQREALRVGGAALGA